MEKIYLHDYRRNKRRRKRKKQAVLALVCFALIALAIILAIVVSTIIVRRLQNTQDASAQQQPTSTLLQPASTNPNGPPYIIALDAGHGGDDVGAEGLVQEYQMNERTVQLLYDLLSANSEFSPVLTRQPGETASVDQRVQAANDAGAHLLLSIHGNSDTIYGSYGFECFPAPPGREHHEGSLRFATALAGEMQAAGARMRGENGVRYIYYQNGGISSADKLICEVSDTNVYNEPSFGMVEKPNCPAVIAEQCFITHEEDYQKFGSEEGCRVAAECYYQAICEYFGVVP